MSQAKYIAGIDKIEIGTSRSLIQGWCFDLSRRPISGPLSLLDGEELLAEITTFFRRADLEGLGLPPVKCGFLAEIARTLLPEVQLSIRDYAGMNYRVALAPNSITKLHPRGRIELATSAQVSGWLYNPEPGPGRPTLVLGERTLVLSPTELRHDLVGAGVVPNDKVGFSINASELSGLIMRDYKRPLKLVCQSVVVDQILIDEPRLLGNIDRIAAHGLSGWAALENAPDQVVTVRVEIDRVPFATLQANEPRSDVRAAGHSLSGGFEIAWGPSPTGSETFQVAVYNEQTNVELKGSPFQVSGACNPEFHLNRTDLRNTSVTVIVPVYNAPAALSRCLEALVKYTSQSATLLIIDDASPDPQVQIILNRYLGRDNIFIRRSTVNKGFVLTIDQAIRTVEGDIILLNADTEVGPRWIQNLLLAAAQRRTIGTVTALSNNAGAFSAPEIGRQNDLPDGLTPEMTARLAAQCAAPIYPAVGTGNGFCMFLRRECFDAIGGFDTKTFSDGYGEENDFCVRASRLGWEHVIDDRTYVLHEREASFGSKAVPLKQAARMSLARYPEYGVIASSFARRGDLAAMRYRLRRTFLEPPKIVRPRLLFVISTRTGGTPQTNRDLMTSITSKYEPLLLVSDGMKLELSSIIGPSEHLLNQHVLKTSIDPVMHTSAEYIDVVSTWLVQYAIEVVHIRHLAWHSIDLPSACQALGIPTIFSFHDYYMICPTVKLLDEQLRFCGGACTPAQGECVPELWSPRKVPPLKHAYVNIWQERASFVLDDCDAFVTTSRSARDVILENFPQFEARFHLIPHGRTFSRFSRAALFPRSDEPFRILVAGSLSRAKGSSLVKKLSMLLRDEGFELHILGNVDESLKQATVTLHGAYKREEFLAKAESIRPAIGLVPSIWAETYCHVLTEMWAAGLPVLAVDIGAVGERIRENGGGWLLAEPDPELAADALRVIRSDPDGFEQCVDRVWDWQEREGGNRTAAVMADDYLKLYEHVLNRRTIFNRPNKTVSQ